MLAALAFAIGIAATPQQAAIDATVGDPRTKAIRTNVVGNVALVRVQGGMDEGVPISGSILVQHFSFGWQALDYVDDACVLFARGLSYRIMNRLMIGQSLRTRRSACREHIDLDGGPQADVAAVREMMPGPFVPTVIVSGRYAVGTRYGFGGGQSVFMRGRELAPDRRCRWRDGSRRAQPLGRADARDLRIPYLRRDVREVTKL